PVIAIEPPPTPRSLLAKAVLDPRSLMTVAIEAFEAEVAFAAAKQTRAQQYLTYLRVEMLRLEEGLLDTKAANDLGDRLKNICAVYDAEELELTERRDAGEDVGLRLGIVRQERDEFRALWNRLCDVDQGLRADVRSVPPDATWRVRHGQPCEFLTTCGGIS